MDPRIGRRAWPAVTTPGGTVTAATALPHAATYDSGNGRCAMK
jgi:hypothetical protein